LSKIITFSEAASIAIHGMVLVARAKHKVNVMEIADAMQSSRHHVAKVFQRLVKENLVESHRGPNGGFSLNKKPGEISLLQIYEAIEGRIEVGACFLERPVCPFNKCLMGNVVNTMIRDYVDFLGRQTLDKYMDY